MSRPPRVSVVLPTFNQAAYLPESVGSVFAQSLSDFELIVVNDGSTDDTPRVLAELAGARSHSELVVIHQENRGLPRALNAGFERARGRYLTWTSSDNIMEPRMLETLADTLDRHPEVGLAYADWTLIDDTGQSRGVVRTFEFDRLLLMRVNYVNACFMYRRACQDAVGLYDPTYAHAEDWEYWWRLAQRFDFVRVPETLYRYRLHAASLTAREVQTRNRGRSAGYERLYGEFRRHRVQWAVSRLKWEWLRRRLGHDPRRVFAPQAW